ncbi:MAG: bifunctional (p)ppGpp synthetase/guanosine-3',5'-bis(diphosphate) 3'-pyrophosphohydrolase [Acidobacteriota bacterium]|nr:bifunctional (p)ppGpp synthetase/guanosine-3',5'-bis(diphosphate) 3'-pyrophosphohydrolase [Acidobacteriota bacterium]
MDLKKTVSAVVRAVGYKPRFETPTFEEVTDEFLKHHPHADKSYLERAYHFGERAHEGQTRRSGEPYFTHPTSVGYILAQNKLDMVTIAAGFLHDTIEDCNVEYGELAQKFGDDLARIVDGVTKIGKVRFRDKEEAQAENYRKMILAMSQDVRVLIVKLADRYHNMQTLGHLKQEKQRRISQETMDIFAPLAQRIGMSHLRNELERLAFYHLEPEAYVDLQRQIVEREKKNRNFLSSIEEELRQILSEHDVPCQVSSRIKSPYSIFKKMRRKDCSLDGLYDYYAFRLITDSVASCYKIFGLLHGRWRHIPGRIKDFIATPKSNLYQSIHTTLISRNGLPFEVQVRTHMMHRIAEEGVAAHWTYKNGRLITVGKNDFVSWLRKVADDNKDVQDSEEFLESIRGQIQSKDILVFTPRSEIKTLPMGSTPLDFAYLIHTEVGHRAVAAKVDGKMVPLRSELQSGNIVEIVTKSTQRPTQEWLSIVKTASARAKIRSYLRAEEREKAVEMGRTLFEQELKRNKVPLRKITRDVITGNLKEFDKKKIEDFYSAIGFGSLTPKKAVRPFLPQEPMEPLEEVRGNRLKKAIQKVKRRSKNMVTVKGHNDILVNLAKCCNPIIGDEIVGYITQGRGIAVHKKDCPEYQRQSVNPERKMEVAWDASVENGQLFRVFIRVFTEDRSGMIADISNAIADTKTNIQNLKADVSETMGIFDIVLQIRSLEHLNKVTRTLKRVKGVLNLERVR